MKDCPIRLPAIIGPTAVGKTEFSLVLAESLGGEIISVDSRQVYRYLDVGTDKVSAEVRKRVIHHCIDVADPDQIFTAADFVMCATEAAHRIIKRDRLPIFVGGTPFYFKALEGGILSDLPSDLEVRRSIELEMALRGRYAMHEELKAVDPQTASRINPNDGHRIARALEIYRLSGKPPSLLYRENPPLESRFEFVYIGLNRPRSDLYVRIEERVGLQFRSGYPEEVLWLLGNGFHRDLPSMQGFGYRELVAWAMGEMTLEEAMAGDIRCTKAFSRRQMTWFKRFDNCLWYDLSRVSMGDILPEVRDRVLSWVEGSECAWL